MQRQTSPTAIRLNPAFGTFGYNDIGREKILPALMPYSRPDAPSKPLFWRGKILTIKIRKQHEIHDLK
jgi:hypothetical protein